jgi:hypothetical protein
MNNCLKPALYIQTAFAVTTTIGYYSAAYIGLAAMNFELSKTCDNWNEEIQETKHETASQYLNSASKKLFCELGVPIIDAAYLYSSVKLYSILMFGSCSAPSQILANGVGQVTGGMIGLFNYCIEQITPGILADNIAGNTDTSASLTTIETV